MPRIYKLASPSALLLSLLTLMLLASCSGDKGTGNPPPLAGEQPGQAAGEKTPSTGDDGGNPDAGNGGDGGDATDGASTEPDIAVIATGLNIPWAIALHEDELYMTERPGQIVRIDRNSNEKQTQPLRLEKEVYPSGEGGLMGFVLDPQFAANGLAYTYHTYRESGQSWNRIIRIRLDGGEWREDAVLLDRIPGAGNHNGGRLAIGPDGMLYATTGDATQPELAQQLDSLAGKVLRMTLEGAVPENNPWPDSLVYTYGHRNAQGLAWDAAGSLYSSEHGPSGRPGGHDELNKLEAGANYGWPDIIGDEQQPGMVSPIYHTGDPAIAPSGIAFDSQGDLWVTALIGQALYKYSIADGDMRPVLDSIGRVRDVAIAGDALYVITNNTDGRGSPREADDRLIRLELP